MGLSGTLRTFPLTDLLQWLHSARKTGTLSVRGERHTKQLFIREGRIISSSSNDPTEQLGQFLLSRGRITEEDLKKGLETQAKTTVLLGKILLITGAIEEEDLKNLLVEKAEETIFSLFLWTDAHFEFCEAPLPRGLFVPILLDVQDVLLKGITIVDELHHVQESFGSAAAVLQRSSRPLPAGFADQDKLGRAVMELVDGQRSITDICLAVHSSEFSVSKLLHDYLEQGYLEIRRKGTARAVQAVGEQESPFVAADALSARGRQYLSLGELEKAMEMLERAIETCPEDLETKRLYDKAREDFREKMHQTVLKPDSVPVLERDLAELTGEKLSPEEVFLISRINGSWDLGAIISISPLGEIDALRIMKRLLDRRIVKMT